MKLKKIIEEIDSIIERDPAAGSRLGVVFLYPSFHVMIFYKIANIFWRYNLKFISRLLMQLARMLTGIEIHPAAKIGHNFFMDHGLGIVIGETAEVGENVTANAKTISDIPKNISNAPEILEIRGEVYMSLVDFNKLNAKQEKKNAKIFANPRNAAAGSLRQLNCKITESRPLKFYAYAWGEVSSPIANKQFDAIKKLEEFGFSTNNMTKRCSGHEELLSLIHI